MTQVEHVENGVIRHTSIGRSEPGDTHDVSEETAAYLCDERGDFERIGVIDAEYEVVDEESEAETEADGGDTFDLDEFLDQNAKPAAAEIRDGDVDEHLDAISDAAERTTVQDAIGERRAELE